METLLLCFIIITQKGMECRRFSSYRSGQGCAVAAFDKVVQGFAPAEKGKAHFIVEGQNGTALLVGMADELIRFRV